ncbi:MAG: glycosyltransferase family 2 protein [Candidatus Fermentibacteraceae bacterium]|nr:glycosyltransferase family 2 protein [Candidatus Fermentibacteraceae bacterium]MBN2608315.1 glycosyltransferase family 2 protein [Candidatus Fermentibacteraceae bacterium]
MDISVVVITWNKLGLLRECIESVRDNARSCSSELIVIDNGSTDGTGEYLGSLKDARILLNARNLGVSRARNQGIGMAGGRYILHLDDDTVMHRGCLDRIVGFMDSNPEVWLSGGKLLNPDGTLQPSARTFYTPRVILARRTPWGRTRGGRKLVARHLMEWWDHDDSRTVDWVCGACFCMRSDAVGRIGTLDENYFFGMEDLDWAFRVWREGGLVAYVHDALVTHVYQRSSRRLFSRKALDHLASLARFHLKHGFRYPERPHEDGAALILD